MLPEAPRWTSTTTVLCSLSCCCCSTLPQHSIPLPNDWTRTMVVLLAIVPALFRAPWLGTLGISVLLMIVPSWESLMIVVFWDSAVATGYAWCFGKGSCFCVADVVLWKEINCGTFGTLTAINRSRWPAEDFGLNGDFIFEGFIRPSTSYRLVPDSFQQGLWSPPVTLLAELL